MADGIFTLIQKGKSFFYLLKEKFTIRSQSDTPGTPFKKNGIQVLLQFLNCLADGRLTDIKFSGAVRDAACLCGQLYKKYDKETDYPAYKDFLSKKG